MNNKKKIGFDILENADMKTIEEIGTGKMNIDKSARERMLKNTMKKYEVEKAKLDITQSVNTENNETEDAVTGVEVYSRKKLPRIIYMSLCSAAAVALVGGSIFAFSRRNRVTPDTKDPVVVATTVETSTNPGTSVTTDQNHAVVTVTVTGTETGTKASATTADATTTTTSATTAKAEEVTDTETAPEDKPAEAETAGAYTNPHTDRADITKEELEAAALRAVKEINNADKASMPELDTGYSLYDVNSDSIPELFVWSSSVLSRKYMLVYDGSEYVIARFNGHDKDGKIQVFEVTTENVDVFKGSNTFGMMGHQAGSQSFILSLGEDNTITPVYEYTQYGIYKDGESAGGRAFDSDTSNFKDFADKYMANNIKELEWNIYNGE